MFTFFTIVQAMRLTLIALRTTASLIILGAGMAQWVKNRKRARARSLVAI